MCGIVGYVGDKEKLNLNSFSLAVSAINHRGPDDWGIEKYCLETKIVALGHARLSIIDLDAHAAQPLVSSCGNYTIIFNGEIYNYSALRKRYLSEEDFQTDSDTEVLLKLYIKKGKSILNSLEGMFAFAVFDHKKQTVFIARDQVGIKPVYFYQDNSKFVFSSEIKSLFQLGVKKELDEYALYEFMLNSFVYEPHTGFKEIKKLKAGHYIEYQVGVSNHKVKPQAYWLPWDARHNASYSLVSEREYCNNVPIESLIRGELRAHTVSDVPVCIFFSGGVDSSVILSELRDIDVITVKHSAHETKQAGFGDDYGYANKISKKLNKGMIEVSLNQIQSKKAFLQAVKKVAGMSEELIADLTFLPTFQISKKAAELGYKVALSGLGADEVFAGYSKYKLVHFRHFYCMLKLLGIFVAGIPIFAKKIKRFKAFCSEESLVWRYTAMLGYFHRNEVGKNFLLFQKDFEEKYFNKLTQLTQALEKKSWLKRVLYLDIFGFLSHNFLVGDKASMQASLELRVPLATKKLFEKTFSMPVRRLLTIKNTKKPLRKILSKTVPKSWINRRKTGFHPPMDKILKEFSKEEFLQEFSQTGLYDIVNQSFVENIVMHHILGKRNNTLQLFQLLYLGYWYQLHIGQDIL